MHIPDGVLDPVALVACGAAAVGAVAAAGWTARRGSPRLASALAGGAAVVAAHLVDVPVYGSLTGHVVGAAALAIALGPGLAVLVLASVLAVEALVWGDGGVAALGANVLVMGVVGVLAAWIVYRGGLRLVDSLAERGAPGDAWRVLAAGIAGVASVLASSVALVGVYAVGGAASVVSGAALAALVPQHLMWGVLEGAVTAAVVAVGLAWRRARARAVARAETGSHRQVHVLDGDMEALG